MRKRICLCICGMLLILGLSACSETGESGLDAAVQEETQAEDVQEPQAAEQSAPEEQISEEQEDVQAQSDSGDAQGNGVLIAYFTWADNTVVTDEEAALQSAHVENMDQYDTIFLGYPIWWGIAAWPVDSFVEANDFTGKTVIPFCTSASSGLGDSGALLAEMAGTGDWQEGMRFRSGADEADVQEWVSGLGL